MIGWFEYGFVRNALVAVLLLAPMLSMMGTLVVNAQMAFFADSLGHSALTGIALGALLGIREPLVSMIGFGLLLALLIVWTRRQSGASADTTIGVFSATAMALGIAVLARGGGFARYSSYLVGDVLSVSAGDLWLLAASLIAVLAFFAFMYNRLALMGVSAALARSRAHNPLLLEAAFAALLAVVVMASIRWIGMLVINAMLVLPAAAARLVARNSRAYTLLAVLIGLFAGVGGLFASFWADTAAGATIVLAAACVYFVLLIARRFSRAGR